MAISPVYGLPELIHTSAVFQKFKQLAGKVAFYGFFSWVAKRDKQPMEARDIVEMAADALSDLFGSQGSWKQGEGK